MDTTIGPAERETITRLVSERFSLNAEEADDLVSHAEARAEQSSQLFGFTRTVKEQFSFEERIELIEMLWEVIYADGHVHHLESNLMRRVAGLIHVPDQESGAARKRVLARRFPDPEHGSARPPGASNSIRRWRCATSSWVTLLSR